LIELRPVGGKRGSWQEIYSRIGSLTYRDYGQAKASIFQDCKTTVLLLEYDYKSTPSACYKCHGGTWTKLDLIAR
jgi:hypothetical protein